MPGRWLGHHCRTERQELGALYLGQEELGVKTPGSEGGGAGGWTPGSGRGGQVAGLLGPGALELDSGTTWCFLPLVKYNRGLSCSRVTILSRQECDVFYPGVVSNNMMCAGLDQGQDPCQVGTTQVASLTPGMNIGR